jgi:CRP-like cAMP-binding protein
MKNYLKSFNIFTDQEIEELDGIGEFKTIEKNEYFSKEGSVCKEVAFVVSGIVRSYYSTSNLEEVTYCFTFPNNFLTAYSSFLTQQPSAVNIQAITKAELYVIPRQVLIELENTSINWLRFSKLIAEKEYMELEQRIFLLQKEKAEKRYDDLISHNSKYLREIPLNYLASYLGITQRHLSRLRKNLSTQLD